jgi:hypothetical protein
MGWNPSGGETFRTCPDRPWGPPSLLHNGYWVFPGVKNGQGVMLTPHPLLVPWSRKGRTIPLLPLWAVWPVQRLSACTRVHFTLTFFLVTFKFNFILVLYNLFGAWNLYVLEDLCSVASSEFSRHASKLQWQSAWFVCVSRWRWCYYYYLILSKHLAHTVTGTDCHDWGFSMYFYECLQDTTTSSYITTHTLRNCQSNSIQCNIIWCI